MSTPDTSAPTPAPTSTSTSTGFTIEALEQAVLDRARDEGLGAGGRPVEPWTAEGGEPVRCCLRDAVAGERLLLVSHAPVLPAPSPYDETGAVFVHGERCPTAPGADTYPRDWVGRPQVLRAYDHRGWIHPATTTHDGTDPLGALADVLGEPGVVVVHSRNVAYGCFMFAARSSSARGAAAS